MHTSWARARPRAGSACFRLRATIGEPVAAFASSADYAIAGGFRASARGADDIFFSGCASSPYATGDAIIGFNPGDVVQISNLGGTAQTLPAGVNNASLTIERIQ